MQGSDWLTASSSSKNSSEPHFDFIYVNELVQIEQGGETGQPSWFK